MKKWVEVQQIDTLILASKRLNIGAFLSISGITMNLQQSSINNISTSSVYRYISRWKNEYTPDFAASNENMLELRDLSIL